MFHAVLRAVQAQPRKFKVYEKGGTLRVSVQDVKNVREAKGALEGVVGVAAYRSFQRNEDAPASVDHDCPINGPFE